MSLPHFQTLASGYTEEVMLEITTAALIMAWSIDLFTCFAKGTEMVVVLQVMSFEPFCVQWEYPEVNVPLTNWLPSLSAVILLSASYFHSYSVILSYGEMGSTRTYTIVSQDCIFQYIWVKWASWGPVTVKIFTGTFIASGTSLTAPGSNRTRRVTSVPIASVFLNLSITRNTITLLENVDGFFYWCEDENSRRQKTICSINTVQLWSNIPQYACGKGILKQLVLIQCFCINQLYFSPLPLVDSWLKYSVWDSTAVYRTLLGKNFTVVRRKEFPFPSGANYANSPIIVKCKPISSKTTAFQDTFSTA